MPSALLALCLRLFPLSSLRPPPPPQRAQIPLRCPSCVPHPLPVPMVPRTSPVPHPPEKKKKAFLMHTTMARFETAGRAGCTFSHFTGLQSYSTATTAECRSTAQNKHKHTRTLHTCATQKSNAFHPCSHLHACGQTQGGMGERGRHSNGKGSAVWDGILQKEEMQPGAAFQ